MDTSSNASNKQCDAEYVRLMINFSVRTGVVMASLISKHWISLSGCWSSASETMTVSKCFSRFSRKEEAKCLRY